MSYLNKFNACVLAVAMGAGMLMGSVHAQNTTPAPANVLSLADIESRMLAQGITIKEVEIHNNAAEIEGYDASGNKVELLLDRRSGEVLSRKTKTRRH